MWCTYSGPADDALFRLNFDRSGSGLDAAFNVSIRQGSVERPLGWIFAFRAGHAAATIAGRTMASTPRNPSTSCSPHQGPVERSVWAPTIWQRQVTIPNVKPRHETLIPDTGG